MGSLSADRARQLLGADLSWRDVKAAHTNVNGTTVLTTPHWWQWKPRSRQRHEVKPGSRLIATGTVLLFVLGCGLLAVSYAAQYAYVLHERSQHIASLIEAGALDVGMIIFALLALGLARAGKPAKIERAAVVVCAAGSALMNFAPADPHSWRSVLAWTMPPVFLAFVVDRTARTVQRHVLAEEEGRSPWAVLGLGSYRLARFMVLAALYSLRFVIDRSGTWAGVKQAIILATPLPAAPMRLELEESGEPFAYCPALTPMRSRCNKVMPCADHPQDDPEWASTHCLVTSPDNTICARELPCRTHDGPPNRGLGTKTARFLEEVRRRHGELSAIPLSQVSKIATAIAPDADLHPASARTALLAAVRAAIPAGEGDAW
jgi:hypothetical protein